MMRSPTTSPPSASSASFHGMSGKRSGSSSSGFGGSTSTNTPSPPFPSGNGATGGSRVNGHVRVKAKGSKYYEFNSRDSQIKVVIRDGRIVEGQETLPYHARRNKPGKSGRSIVNVAYTCTCTHPFYYLKKIWFNSPPH